MKDRMGKICCCKVWEAQPRTNGVLTIMLAIWASGASRVNAEALRRVVCAHSLGMPCGWGAGAALGLAATGPFVLEGFGDVKSIWGS